MSDHDSDGFAEYCFKSNSYLYLGSPYSHTDPFIREERYLKASKVLAEFLTKGIWTYSPIVHCHELAKIGGLPTEALFWKGYNFFMLLHSRGLLVLQLDGWDASIGLQDEIKEAKRLGLPVQFREESYAS